MRRMGKWLRFNSIRSQIIISFTAIMILLTMTIAGVFYSLVADYITDSQQSENEAYTTRVANNIDNELGNMQLFMRSTVYNDDVTQALADYPRLPLYEQYRRAQQVQGVLKGGVMDQSDVQGAYLYSPDAFFRYEPDSAVDRFSPRWGEFERQVWEREVAGALYTPLYRPDYLDSSVQGDVFSILMPVVHVSGGGARRIGTMALSVEASFFLRTTEIQGQGGNYAVAVLDENGRALFCSGDGSWLADMQREGTLAAGTQVVSGAIYSLRQSGVNGWQYLVRNDLSDLQGALRRTAVLMVFLVMAAIVLIVLLAAVITTWATRSVGDLSRYMRAVQQGNRHASLEKTSSCVEIDQLYEGMSGMMGRINTLIDENYLRKIREQEAKLEFLQAQTTPHFLNNTLQMITSLAILDRTKDIELVSAKFANLLSYVTYEPGTIALRQELAYIRDYLDIENIRYNGKFTLEEDVPEAFFDLPVSKLFLQPLVENAVMHGFLAKARDCRIRLTVWRDGELLCFSVWDNGCGIAEEKLAELNGALTGGARPRGEGHGVGLWNIRERLSLLYGGRGHIRVESETGRFTRVTIHFPAQEAMVQKESGE